MPSARRHVSSLVALVIVSGLGLTAMPGNADAGELPSDVQAVIRKQFASPDAETRYLDGTIDLDGDGKPEIVVHVLGTTACGSGGCSTLVFTRAASGYRLVSTISVSRAPIRAADGATKGWRNLIVRVGGGGGKSRDVELSFDGTSYPENPTVTGARVQTTRSDGAEVLIKEIASFEDAALLAPGDDAPVPAVTAAAAPAGGSGPSFACAKASTQVEKTICSAAGLAALDRELSMAYTQAMRGWSDDTKTSERAAQRQWMRDRNGCTKTADVEGCVAASYRRRLAEVQIRGGQLTAPTPVAFVCDGHADTPFTVAFYAATDPPSAAITFGDRQTIALAVRTGSGARYTSAAVDFWEHHGEATVVWSGVKYLCKTR